MAYVEAGFDEASFRRLTPRMYLIIMKGVEARHRARVEMAWVGAVLARVDKLPPLEKLFEKPKPSPASAAMLRAEMRAHARTMTRRKWSEWQSMSGG